MDRRRFLAAAAGSVAGATAGSAQKKSVLKLVSSLPRTGPAKAQTDTIVNGIRLAIDDYGGEIAGFTIQLLDLDDATAVQGSWDVAAEAGNARKAIADPAVMAYLGPYNSGAAKVSMPILNEVGLVQISPACTWPGLTKKFEGLTEPPEPDVYRRSKKLSFCRVCPHDGTQGPLSADFAHAQKVKSVYILDDKEIYGAGVANFFRKRCKELGIEVLGHQSIVHTFQDFQAILKQVKATKPDLVYFGGTTQTKGAQIARDMVTVGVGCPLMVPDGCYEQAFIDAAGKDVFEKLTCYVTIGGIVPSQLTGRGVEFVKKYVAKHKAEPEAYAVYGYEAATVVLEAIGKVGKNDREGIRVAVLSTKDFDAGALGKWSFDADGDTTLQQLTISTIADGKFKPVKVVSR